MIKPHTAYQTSEQSLRATRKLINRAKKDGRTDQPSTRFSHTHTLALTNKKSLIGKKKKKMFFSCDFSFGLPPPLSREIG